METHAVKKRQMLAWTTGRHWVSASWPHLKAFKQSLQLDLFPWFGTKEQSVLVWASEDLATATQRLLPPVGRLRFPLSLGATWSYKCVAASALMEPHHILFWSLKAKQNTHTHKKARHPINSVHVGPDQRRKRRADLLLSFSLNPSTNALWLIVECQMCQRSFRGHTSRRRYINPR